MKPAAKDSNDLVNNNELGAKEEFANNNFWRAEAQYDLKELLNEVE